MEALILTLFVSLVLVGLAIVLLVKAIRGGDVDHADRLSLLPLEPETRESQSTQSSLSEEKPL